MKRYLVIPGYVVSANDGDEHFIDAPRLMQLYNVSPKDCIVATQRDLAFADFEGMTVLRPRYDGNYSLPNNGPEKVRSL